MKKKHLLLLMMILTLSSVAQLFGADSPLEIMTEVGIEEAQENLIPASIAWILILTGIMAAIMQKIMPFVVGCVCCIVIALAPELATSFSTFDFAANTTTLGD